MQLYLQIRILTEASEFHCRERQRRQDGEGEGVREGGNEIHGVCRIVFKFLVLLLHMQKLRQALL